jgi:hypothetical protein
MATVEEQEPTPGPAAVDQARAMAGPATPDATAASTAAAVTTDKPSLLSHESVDSGIDTGSSSEYDQENHGDHVIEAQEEGNFSDEG